MAYKEITFLNAVTRLVEKVERANSLQHSRRSHTIPAEDWAELFQLTGQIRALMSPPTRHKMPNGLPKYSRGKL